MIRVDMICPLCQMTIRDRPLEKWQPRTLIKKTDDDLAYAHTACVDDAVNKGTLHVSIYTVKEEK